MPDGLQTEPQPAPLALPPGLAELCAEELRKRLPLLLAAAASGDCANARVEAHAMKGVAANFTLATLAEQLCRLEQAARAGELAALRQGCAGLAPKLELALRDQLGC